MDHVPATKPIAIPWVGMWKGRRHVVYDAAIQPQSADFMLLYFVQGQSLCIRSRFTDRTDVSTISDSLAKEFALTQYALWKSRNQQLIDRKRSLSVFETEHPGSIRRKCSVCYGNPHSTWTVGTFSDGAHSDGQNMGEHCSACKGQGYVDNTIEA